MRINPQRARILSQPKSRVAEVLRLLLFEPCEIANLQTRVCRGTGLLLCAAVALLPSLSFAQDEPVDKVVLQPKKSSSRIKFTCVIVDFTGEKITIRNRQSTQLHTYSADEVIEVQTPQTKNHVRGLISFAEGDLEQATTRLGLALIEETRNWVRRDILAQLIKCALLQGDYIAAGTNFLALWQSDKTTRQFKLAPLAWGPHNTSPALKNEALGWINLGTEASRLLGASHLLTDDRHAARAQQQMNKLASSPDERVRLLARAQLWRLTVRKGKVIPAELKRWQARIESMPSGIRGGPYYVLGRGYLTRKEYDRAAAAFLWIPLVYDYDMLLAARACLEAADALQKVGQDRNARALYREVTTRFAGTPFADEAAALLKSHKSNEEYR